VLVAAAGGGRVSLPLGRTDAMMVTLSFSHFFSSTVFEPGVCV
jgi:hypothetical protein